ncbi:MAG TPA: RidA family protein [Longimicrobiales bacterium]|nr:RidA family protein [Longimicrobiales bacterium]
MTRYRRIAPAELGAPSGFSHGLLADQGGRMLFVAGQTATGPDGSVVGGGLAEQFGVALDRVLAVVRAAGGAPESVGGMTVFVTDMGAYRAARRELGGVWRDRMGDHYPAMALVAVTELVDEGALLEIEATAMIWK